MFTMTAKKQKKDTPPSLYVTNKKAYFHYHVIENLECGIALQGTEIKSMRAKTFSFTDAFVEILQGELFLKKFHISPYKNGGSVFNHKPERHRKLLAHKKQIDGLQRKVKEKGMTLVPLKIYLKGSVVKVEIGLCRGKKLYDKRDSIKEKDLNRDLARSSKML